ncbi:N-acetylmuramoyl-L-alanine amidase [Yaniella halotolerans]|uniref:N-acetylmuramoyl-L-alanine amidase n=1 Tax=Yaniella halotolerans TaxID=225453 RepID=UPI0003B30D3C|nr:N-acetylmuramoyl-L-alanine amidase [Yaniella halotolerans]
MRKITPLVLLSFTASSLVATETAHATTDTAPSSYVIDLLQESKIIDKELAELENPEEFEIESAARSNIPQGRPVSTDSTAQLEEDSEAEVEHLQEGHSRVQEESLGEDETSGESPDNNTVEETPQQQEEQVPDTEPVPDEQESPSATGTYSLLTDPLETEAFHVAGVTWEGTAPEQIDIRAYSNDGWSEWLNLEIDETDEGTDGTEPIMAAGSDGIQVRASGEILPDAFNVHLMTGDGSTGEEKGSKASEAEDQPAQDTELKPAENVSATTSRNDHNFLLSNTTVDETPQTQLASNRLSANIKAVPFSKNIVSRTQWGAPRDASWRTRYASLEGAIVHHTAGTNSYTRAQAPNIVKGIWSYHTFTRGWGDIGYNFLIDKYGTVYEGRSGSVDSKAGEMAIGAHAAPANTGSVGVSVLGSYTGNTNPSSTVLDTISEIIAWQFAMADIDPKGTFTYRNSSGNNVSTNAISGHRNISATICPGNIYPRLGTIRNSVASKIDDYAPNPTPTPTQRPVFDRAESSGSKWPLDNAWSVGDLTTNDTTDLLLRDPEGYIHVYEGRGDNSFRSPVQIGRGWNIFPELYTGVDFDGDSVPDILGIDKEEQLFRYSGNGRGGVHEGDQIGRGWNFEHHMVFEEGPGKNPAIVGITNDGILRVYQTDGRGSFTDSPVVGSNFSHLHGAVPVGDWDNTGYSDMVYVTDAGYLHFMSDPIQNDFSNSVQIGQKWDGLTIMPGDSSGGENKLLVIAPDGKLMTYIFTT